MASKTLLTGFRISSEGRGMSLVIGGIEFPFVAVWPHEPDKEKITNLIFLDFAILDAEDIDADQRIIVTCL